MRKLPIVLILLLVALLPALGQDRVRIYKQARVPSRDTLQRLGLVLMWSARAPVESQRDGLASVQLITSERTGDQLVVQTLSGHVQLMDVATGDILWRTVAGVQPYEYTQPAAWNSRSIMVSRREWLYFLHRETGRHRVFTVQKTSNLPNLGFPMAQAPSSIAVADEEHLYVPANDRVAVYLVPKFQPDHLTLSPLLERGLKKPTDKLEESLQPEYGWAVRTVNAPVTFPLVLSNNQLAVLSGNGTYISLNALGPVERFTYKFDSTVAAPMGSFDDVAYVGCEDHILYALHMISRKLLWRYMAGGPIQRRPEATERDVFVTALKVGMARVDRENGERIWLNKEADQFLATNHKFVWALDRHHQLLVLDYLKGTTLARADFSDYQMPLSNPDTDRIFLANHDGTIVCLRHRDNVEPMRLRPIMERLPPKPKPPEPKPDEKEKEKEKAGWLRPRQRELLAGEPHRELWARNPLDRECLAEFLTRP